MWIGLLHYVCNIHDWLGEKCMHAEKDHDDNLPWFDRWDNDFAELQKVILNLELLGSFKYYARFRYELFSRCYQINVFAVSTYTHNVAYSVINKTSETNYLSILICLLI